MAKNKKTSVLDLEDLLFFWKIISNNWQILVISLILAFVSCYFYTYRLTDIYTAKSQILLKSDETYDYQSQLYKGLGYFELGMDNSNQIKVITSNNIIGKAISKLNLDVSYYIIGRIKTQEVYQSVPFEVNAKFLNPTLYEKEIRFNILNKNEYQLIYQKGDDKIVRTHPFNKEIVETDYIMSVKKNPIINDNTIEEGLTRTDYSFRIHDITQLVYKYKTNLTVENLENTSVLELSVLDEIPSRAVIFLDTLSKVYVEYTAESQIRINENTLANIDKQLREITEILTSIEDDMEKYKSQKSVLNITKEEDEYFKKMVEYDDKKRQIQLWISSYEALEKYIVTIGSLSTEKLLPPSFYVEPGDDYLKTALNELYTKQMSRNERLFNSTVENRNITELDQNVELLRMNILTYISNSKNALKTKIEAVEKQIEEYSSIIKDIPKTQRDLLTIQRKLDVNEKMYVYLLEKRANTVIARAGIIPEINVIESAHSGGIVAPDKKKILYYFLLAGFIVGLSIVFVRVMIFSRIESVQELKKMTSLPILGEIVLTNEIQDNYLVVDKNPKHTITECFRAIRTNLEYLAANPENAKTVLITSYNPGEGKTFCSVNLGIILAKAEKKVLLLELDLHRPKVQKALNMNTEIGISTILIGKSKIEDSILPTQIENMSVILSGPIPPNASELVLSKRLEEMIDYGRKNFDYIIVDTPPVGLITDALVIMKYVDVSLFILNSKHADRNVVSFVEEIVEMNKFKNFGLILNGVKRKGHGYYRYGYKYGGYHYDYSYGMYSNKKS